MVLYFHDLACFRDSLIFRDFESQVLYYKLFSNHREIHENHKNIVSRIFGAIQYFYDGIFVSMHSVSLRCSLKQVSSLKLQSPVHSLSLTYQSTHLLVGLADGKLVIVTCTK